MTGEPLLAVRGLAKHFPIMRGILFPRPVGAVRAVDGLDFEVGAGETLALVGESGCGKSTTARAIMHLSPFTGSVKVTGKETADITGEELRALRRDVQMIFQDPHASLDPRMNVGDLVGEPLVIHRLASGTELKDRVADLFQRVGLSKDHATRYPHEFSGGQRQRICIARALAMEPELLIADEAVSALDVSVQAQVLQLLEEIRARLNLAMLFITHDLRVAAQVCDQVAVMSKGRVVEYGPAEEVFLRPRHEYTRALFESAPGPRFAFGQAGSP